MNITTGKIAKAQKVVLYGVEGIGKSTFASHFPEPVFIDTEGSTNNMDVARFDKPTSWKMLLKQIEFVKNNRPCKTLVIDTADWAEILAKNDVIAEKQIKSIEDLGYGKGYVLLSERIGAMLNSLSDLTELGVNVVITAHAKLEQVVKPDEMGSYDHYTLKMEKRTAPLLKEWADLLLFANYETTLITDSKTNKTKATGGQRVMYTSHRPAWDAKNRHGLPDKMNFEFASIAQLFNVAPQQKQAQQSPEQFQQQQPLQEQELTKAVEKIVEHGNQAVQEQPQEPLTQQSVERVEVEIDPQINKELADLMKASGIKEEDIQMVVGSKGWLPSAMPVRDYPIDLVQGALIAQWDKVIDFIKQEKGLPF